MPDGTQYDVIDCLRDYIIKAGDSLLENSAKWECKDSKAVATGTGKSGEKYQLTIPLGTFTDDQIQFDVMY